MAYRSTVSAGLGLAIALVAGAVIGCAPDDPVARLRAPKANVVLVTIDTLRADHLGCYGYERDTSVNIDAVARGAVLFQGAFAQRGLTFPSISSFMTSKYVESHQVMTMKNAALSEHHETLAELLRERGLRTAGFSAHPALNRNTGFAQGFEDYRTFSMNEERMVEAVGGWLKDRREEQFFLWVHFFGPHPPYQPPAPWDQRFTRPDYAGGREDSVKALYDIEKTQQLSEERRHHLIALYDGKLARVDHLFGKIVQQLDELDLRDETLLIVSADHGEELFDHFLYFGHEASVYDGVLRIPLLMSFPGCLPEGPIGGDHIVESVDLAPTILDVLDVPRGSEMQGQSLLPLLAGIETDDHQYAYGTIDRGYQSRIWTIRTKQWRYVHNPKRYPAGTSIRHSRRELYDVQNDPTQQEDLSSAHPEVVAELEREILRWQGWTEERRGARGSRIDPEMEAQLKALGYLDDGS